MEMSECEYECESNQVAFVGVETAEFEEGVSLHV